MCDGSLCPWLNGSDFLPGLHCKEREKESKGQNREIEIEICPAAGGGCEGHAVVSRQALKARLAVMTNRICFTCCS